MNKLKKNAIVPYTQQQMFTLVNTIEDYPRFLPWCSSSRIISRTDTEVVAELEIAWKGVRKSFTTRNILTPNSQMDMKLVNGPLKHMDGIWIFTALNETACKVELDLEFEFAGGFFDKLFQPIFQGIANSMVDAFCKRAVELYGKE